MGEMVLRAAEGIQMEDSMMKLKWCPSGTENARPPPRGRDGGAEIERADCDGRRAGWKETASSRPLLQDQAHSKKMKRRAARPEAQQEERAPEEPSDLG